MCDAQSSDSRRPSNSASDIVVVMATATAQRERAREREREREKRFLLKKKKKKEGGGVRKLALQSKRKVLPPSCDICSCASGSNSANTTYIMPPAGYT